MMIGNVSAADVVSITGSQSQASNSDQYASESHVGFQHSGADESRTAGSIATETLEQLFERVNQTGQSSGWLFLDQTQDVASRELAAVMPEMPDLNPIGSARADRLGSQENAGLGQLRRAFDHALLMAASTQVVSAVGSTANTLIRQQ